MKKKEYTIYPRNENYVPIVPVNELFEAFDSLYSILNMMNHESTEEIKILVSKYRYSLLDNLSLEEITSMFKWRYEEEEEYIDCDGNDHEAMNKCWEEVVYQLRYEADSDYPDITQYHFESWECPFTPTRYLD